MDTGKAVLAFLLIYIPFLQISNYLYSNKLKLMSKLLTYLLAICLFICGCKKDDMEDPDAMKYTIGGITDMTLNDAGDTTIGLAIAHTSGKQEKLELSATDLPSGLTVTFATPSGIPSFSTLMTYSAKNAATGTHTAKLKATTASGKSQTFDIKLTINHWDCGKSIAGKYLPVSSSFADDVVVETTSTEGQIKITDETFSSDPFSASVNCANKTITVPKFEFRPGYYLEGTGTFEVNPVGKIKMHYIVGGIQYAEVDKEMIKK
jgi:hypothetical protein